MKRPLKKEERKRKRRKERTLVSCFWVLERAHLHEFMQQERSITLSNKNQLEWYHLNENFHVELLEYILILIDKIKSE